MDWLAIAKDWVVESGPWAIGWGAAWLLYRDSKKEREHQLTANEATAKALQELSIYVKALKR